MLLNLSAIGAGATLVWHREPGRLTTLSRCAIAFAGAVLLLPALQLVPLAPSVWHSLPGREGVAQIDAGLGLNIWRPLTLDIEGARSGPSSASFLPSCSSSFACDCIPASAEPCF